LGIEAIFFSQSCEEWHFSNWESICKHQREKAMPSKLWSNHQTEKGVCLQNDGETTKRRKAMLSKLWWDGTILYKNGASTPQISLTTLVVFCAAQIRLNRLNILEQLQITGEVAISNLQKMMEVA
jgi:hypothetical protein